MYTVRGSKSGLDSGLYAVEFPDSRYWISDSNCEQDSRILELYSGFQSQRFQIPPEKNFPDSELHKQNFPNSEIWILLHRVNMSWAKFEVINEAD